MAKADAPRIKRIVVQRETIAQPEVNIKNYVDLLWVVGAGVIGVSLLCVTAAIALANPNTSTILQSQSIIQIAIANVSTAAALTVEAFPQNLITPTLALSNTQAASNLTFSPTVTSIPPTVAATRIFISMTNTPRPRLGGGPSNTNPYSTPTWLPTRTLAPTLTSSPVPPTLTSSPIPPPTITNTPGPTRTPRPTRTLTPVPPPTRTRTPVPPPTRTRTPVPPPTDTSAPPPTDTSAPPPTNTSAPPPTDTSAPPPTNTPAPPPTDTSAPPPTDTPAADVPTATPGP